MVLPTLIAVLVLLQPEPLMGPPAEPVTEVDPQAKDKEQLDNEFFLKAGNALLAEISKRLEDDRAQTSAAAAEARKAENAARTALMVAGFGAVIQLFILWRTSKRDLSNQIRQALAEYGGTGLEYLSGREERIIAQEDRDYKHQRHDSLCAESRFVSSEDESDNLNTNISKAERDLEQAEKHLTACNDAVRESKSKLSVAKAKMLILSLNHCTHTQVCHAWDDILFRASSGNHKLDLAVSEGKLHEWLKLMRASPFTYGEWWRPAYWFWTRRVFRLSPLPENEFGKVPPPKPPSLQEKWAKDSEAMKPGPIEPTQHLSSE